MSKKDQYSLMFPGSSSWELWSFVNGESSLSRDDLGLKAGESKFAAAGGLGMALPLSALTVMPFATPTQDDSVFRDIAQLHVEKLGMKPAPQHGELFDWSLVEKTEEASLLYTAVLHPLSGQDLPQKDPNQFHSAAYCLPLTMDSVTVWRELGKYVMAVTKGENLLFTQCLTVQEAGKEMIQEVQLALIQLSHQLLLTSPQLKWLFWESETDRLGESKLRELESTLGSPILVQQKPSPQLPENWGMFLPADIEAERTREKAKKQTVRTISLAALLYLAVLAYFGYALWSERSAALQAEEKYQRAAPEAEALQEHNQKWSEIRPLVEKEHHPLELLYRCSRALPRRGIRLKDAQMVNQLQVSEDGSQRMVRAITLKGEAEDFGTVTEFNKKLENNNMLSSYRWEKANPVEGKDGRWSFLMSAVFNEGGEEK